MIQAAKTHQHPAVCLGGPRRRASRPAAPGWRCWSLTGGSAGSCTSATPPAPPRSARPRPQPRLMTAPHTLAGTTPVAGAVRAMRERRAQLALVTDEVSATVGIVTLEDSLEEVVGEFNDE